MFRILIYRRLFLTFFFNFLIFLLFIHLFFYKKNKFINFFDFKSNYNLNYIKIFYLEKKSKFKYFLKFNSHDKFI